MNDPTLKPLRGVAIYNPALLNRRELKDLFIARKPLLNRLLSDIKKETQDGPLMHHLIVGARGMGKTTLLRMLGFAIEDDAELSRDWLPLPFPEEQYNIGRLSHLWMNCLDALGDVLETRGQTSEAMALDSEVAALHGKDEDQLARRALAMLSQKADAMEKRLVLLIDNLDIVFNRLKNDHWAIREALSSAPNLLLVGASSQAIEAAYKYDQAFYDFFQIHELKGLTREEMESVLLHLAEIGKTPHVAALVKNEPSRPRTLHVLTGGNPRTIVLLYNVLAIGDKGDVRTDLERLLDMSTPLYKARFEELSIQAQRIVDALAIAWDPLRAGDLTGRLQMPVNAVSAQLNRLVHQGVVEKVKFHPGKKAGFQIAERFFNIWYLMRASRRLRRKLIWLVEFLKLLYSHDDLKNRALKQKAVEVDPENCFSLNNIAWFLYIREGDLVLAEEHARKAANLNPENFNVLHTLAMILLAKDNWPEAEELIKKICQKSSSELIEEIWEDIIDFFKQSVAAGYIKEAASLVESMGKQEEWRPLLEALKAIREGTPAYLRSVAPEIREPALELLNQIAPDFQQLE